MLRPLLLFALVVAVILGLAWLGSAPPVLAYAEATAPAVDVPCESLRSVMADNDRWLAFNGYAGGQLVLPRSEGVVDLVLMVLGARTSLHMRFRNDCLVETWQQPMPG